MDDNALREVVVPLMTSLQKDGTKTNKNGGKKVIAEVPNVLKKDDIPLEPPDGGWGWCVVVGSTLCYMLVGMQGPCFGIFYVNRLIELGSSPTLAAWLFNFQAFCYNFAGPWAALLCRKFSHRIVALISAFMACSSFIISAFVTNPNLLLFTFSFICGVGGGICNNCCFLMNAKYFKHRLGLANGMMMAGGSLGLMILPQLASYLQEVYPFEWANIIAGTAMMNVLPATLLFQPVERHLKKPNIASNYTVDEVPSAVSNDSFQTAMKMEKTVVRPPYNTSRLSFLRRSSPRSVPRGVSVPHNLLDETSVQKNTEVQFSMRRVNTMSESPFMNVRNRKDSIRGLGEMDTPKGSKLAVFYLGGSTIMGSVLTLQHFPFEEKNDTPREGKELSKEAPSTQGLKKKLLHYFHPSIICDPLLLSVALFTSITIPTAINIFSATPFVLKDAGYDLQSAATAMTVNAVVDLMTRLVCSVIIDQPWARPRAMYGTAHIILISIPFALIIGWHYWWAVLLCMGVMGVALGIIYTLDVFLMARLLGMDRLVIVLGTSQVIRAINFLCLGPIGGTLRDVTGSYAYVFLFYVGAMVVAFMILLFTIFYTRRHPPRPAL